MNDQNMTVLTNIIGAVESGDQNYGKRNFAEYAAPYTNSNIEHTVTLGWAQNYGNEARKLILMILDKMGETEFKKIDKDGSIFNMRFHDWEAERWNPTAAQKKTLVALIDSKAGHECQDELFARLTETFIAECEKTYTKSIPAVMMYCEIRHLGGAQPVKRIFDRLGGDYSLDAIMASLVKDQRDTTNDNQVGDAKFWSRHVKCKTFIEQYAVPETEERKDGATMTVAQIIQKLIDLATAELGYLEKKSNASLDDKTANAGSANYTKYWRDVYPQFQGQAWCACFISWLFMQLFGVETAKKLLKHWPFVYCPTLAGVTANKTPKVGSIILFYRNGTYAHTGLVVAVSSTTVTTIEGNTSGASGIIANGGGVCKKTYAIKSLSSETKYFMPDYGSVSTVTKTGGTATGGADDMSRYIVGSGKVEVKHFLVGANDPQVKTIQRLLNAMGYKGKDKKKLTVDGDLGQNTSYAIAAFQKAVGMNPDNPGTVATKTWEKLLNAE